MLHQQEKTLEAIMNLTNSLPQIVCDAISQKAAESGHVTVEYVMDALDTSTNSIKALIETSVHDSICKAMKYHNVRTEGLMVVEAEEGQGVEWPIAAYREYIHADGFRYAVPPGFEFSSCSLRLAWNAWLVGFPGNRSSTATLAPVRPLRFILQNTMLPPGKVRNSFKDGWKPILSCMAKFVKRELDRTRADRMDSAFRDRTYMVAIQGLQTKRPELFVGKNTDKSKQWTVATWSRKIRGF
jgi:hypothetical protein